MSAPLDDPPTEAWPAITPPGGDDEGLVDDEWVEPRRRSRVTIALVMALLVALGFLAGVLVGRAGATSTPAGGGTSATISTARPAPPP